MRRCFSNYILVDEQEQRILARNFDMVKDPKRALIFPTRDKARAKAKEVRPVTENLNKG